MNVIEPVGLKHIAVVGNPNCGKSSLFNALTGLRQKVANYPGATVERRAGPALENPAYQLLDLPGTYSLDPSSADEAITQSVLAGTHPTEAKPDAVILVLDATNLGQHLQFALEYSALQIPTIVALNMMDLAAREEIELDPSKLSEALGVPVIETVAVRRKGLSELIETIAQAQPMLERPALSLSERQREARRISKSVLIKEGIGHKTTQILDSILLNPLAGLLILFGLLFTMFQAVFGWAEAPMELLEGGVGLLQTLARETVSEGWLLSLINDGILAGVGSVVVFLPQILILFTFILFLESTGYMARAAFLLDKLMAGVGLNGRAFIPLLSSFACAIPGIMSARNVPDEKDRLTTILIAPLMTCSARLPVYTVIIAAFIPNETVGGIGLQGLVMFSLYIIGIVSALVVAFVFRKTLTKGESQPFLMELPKYQMPNVSFIFMGLYQRSVIFLRRAGTIIMASTVVLWLLAIWPTAPDSADKPDIAYSLIGRIGSFLEVIFAPIGFNWEISVALVPGMAAREVAVAALGTVYALSGDETVVEAGLVTMLNSVWSLPTALSFLAWFVFAPQCLSTIAVTRRETGGWRWPMIMLGYLFGLAYAASFVTYTVSKVLLGT